MLTRVLFFVFVLPVIVVYNCKLLPVEKCANNCSSGLPLF